LRKAIQILKKAQITNALDPAPQKETIKNLNANEQTVVNVAYLYCLIANDVATVTRNQFCQKIAL